MNVLYHHQLLDDIRRELLSGRRKFKIGIYNMAFSESDDGFIQRIPNFALGLGYIKSSDSWVFNYPHINNIKKDELETMMPAYIEPKYNGTNILVCRAGNELWHRTRGTINPAKFLNDINTAIIQNKSSIIGIAPETFKTFRERYEPILKIGIEKGMVDAYGNFVLKPEIVNTIKAAMAPAFEIKSVVTVCGELCSRFNPICVSQNIDAGIYIDNALDYQYVIFDVLSRTEEGDIVFWDASTIDQLPIVKSPNISIAQVFPLSINAFDQFMSNTKEEGVIVKSPNLFAKLKKAEVLAWERLVGNLSNIVIYSVNHIFEQEFSFSSEEILAGKLLQLSIMDEIRKAAYEEMENNGISHEELINFYISRDARNRRADQAPMTTEAAKTTIERSLNDQIVEKLLLLVAPALRDHGIDKSKLYLEIPKVFAFPKGNPIFYDEKRAKYRPYEWYGKLVSSIIGQSHY